MNKIIELDNVISARNTQLKEMFVSSSILEQLNNAGRIVIKDFKFGYENLLDDSIFLEVDDLMGCDFKLPPETR